MVECNRGHHLNVVPYLGKILIRGLRGIKCPKFRFFDIFSQTGYYKFLIFCMIVEGNIGHHLSMVLYLGKILIWDQLHGCSKTQLRRSQSNVLPTCCFRLRKEASNGCATGGVRKSPLFAQIFSIWINFFFKWTAEGSCVCPINFFSSKSENYLFTYHLSAALLCIEISRFFRSFLRSLH